MARTTLERITKLHEILDSWEDRLLDLSRSPKVSYDVDGQQFSFNEYQKIIMENITALDALILQLENVVGTGEMTVTQIFA